MIVVSDTTPLNYLILIDVIDVLPKLYGTVMIPRAVWLEMSVPLAPASVRQFGEGANLVSSGERHVFGSEDCRT